VVERSYIPSESYEIAKNGEKTGGFAYVLAYNSPKTPFFAQKYLKRYFHETFFEEYTNFQAHYFSHCIVIPLQSFRSHIRPQPHGLGLKNIGFIAEEKARSRLHRMTTKKLAQEKVGPLTTHFYPIHLVTFSEDMLPLSAFPAKSSWSVLYGIFRYLLPVWMVVYRICCLCGWLCTILYLLSLLLSLC
jgi:hypothetical protein